LNKKELNKTLLNPTAKRKFTKHLLNDIKAFEILLNENFFEIDKIRIGAEQELALVGNDWKPALIWDKILEEVKDEHFTTELAKFNLEVNLDPIIFENNCFYQMEKQLKQLLEKGRMAAKKYDTKVVLTGILPTITKVELEFDRMTPNPRFKMLNDVIRSQKGRDFEIVIRGIDELSLRHPNILFEACNTSFQIHLQIKPNEFIEKYNWAQLISAPVLASAANSPLLMGRRLWHESRIAVFEQSIDQRSRNIVHRDIQQRVNFSNSWLEDSVINVFKDNVSRFNLLLLADIKKDSVEEIKKGNIPILEALRLYNSTLYSWNRVCYGISDTELPHLRIENRYLPSGPTIKDEIANAVFWLGLMEGMPEEYKGFEKKINFDEVRYNFYRASQLSLGININWMGKSYSMPKLILDVLLPLAEKGLQKRSITDCVKYLDIIRQRTIKNINGAIWMERNFTYLCKDSTLFEAAKNITQLIYENEMKDLPLHSWKDLNKNRRFSNKKFETAEQIMITDISTVQEDDSFELILSLMEWRDTRYIFVENFEHELVGVVSSRRIIKEAKKNFNMNRPVKEIMVKNPITIGCQTSIANILRIMTENGIGCLPVVSKDNKLLGGITERSLLMITHQLGKFKD